MSEVFEGYERQYCELSAGISRKCNSFSPADPGQKEKLVSEIKAGLEDGDILIRKMDLEARSLQPNTKAMLLAKLREYKADLNNLKKEFKRLTSPNADQAAREELLKSAATDAHLCLLKERLIRKESELLQQINSSIATSEHDNIAACKASAEQRERMAMSIERINQSSDRIMESRRTMLETEELGVSILQDLHQQRETLLHSHNKLHGVDDAIDKSKKVLTTMSRRITQNKMIIGAIIGALVFAIIVVLYIKISH